MSFIVSKLNECTSVGDVGGGVISLTLINSATYFQRNK